MTEREHVPNVDGATGANPSTDLVDAARSLSAATNRPPFEHTAVSTGSRTAARGRNDSRPSRAAKVEVGDQGLLVEHCLLSGHGITPSGHRVLRATKPRH